MCILLHLVAFLQPSLTSHLIVCDKTYIHFGAHDLILALCMSVRIPTLHVCMCISQHTLKKKCDYFSHLNSMFLLTSQLQCYNRTWYRACISFSAFVANVRYAEEQKQIYAMCGNFQLNYSIWLGFCNRCDVDDIIYSPSYLFLWHILHFKKKCISLISYEESFWIVKPDDGCYVQPKHVVF